MNKVTYAIKGLEKTCLFNSMAIGSFMAQILDSICPDTLAISYFMSV
ncbi:MAG: hypothetical protein FWE11_09845 [Defluviitaleaceae bacterium]|nr:hypothetical protein [Defluviitaleaceae bacterium]